MRSLLSPCRSSVFGALALFLLLTLTQCGTLARPTYDVELTEDAMVTINGEQAVQKKKGDRITLEDSSYALIEAPGRIPMIVAPRSGPGRVKVSLKETALAQATPEEKNHYLNEVVFEMSSIQSLISKGKPREALAEVERAEKKLPGIGAFAFLKATCLVLLDETHQAKSVLEEALKIFPENTDGKALYDYVVSRDRTER